MIYQIGTAEALSNWLLRGHIGSVVSYHQGLLVKDRVHDKEANRRANVAWDAASKDCNVLLTQMRLGPSRYLYLAKRVWKDPA